MPPNATSTTTHLESAVAEFFGPFSKTCILIENIIGRDYPPLYDKMPEYIVACLSGDASFDYHKILDDTYAVFRDELQKSAMQECGDRNLSETVKTDLESFFANSFTSYEQCRRTLNDVRTALINIK